MIFAGNFKANHTRATTSSYIRELETLCEDTIGNDRIYIFPPQLALDRYGQQKIHVGIQNAYPAEKGAYTGEVCLDAIDEFGIDTILIGHSERRHILKEPQEFIARKYDFFRRNNFTIFYCVGEPIEVRQKGIDAVLNYIEKQFENIDTAYPHLIVAYEPVWAIGTGLTATSEDIDEVHKKLKESIDAPIVYGGSVNASNVGDILHSSYVDGVLVGGASLKADEFFDIITLAKQSRK